MARIAPQGPYLLVHPLEIEKLDAAYLAAKRAGIEIVKGRESETAKSGVDRGKVLAIGNLCWKDWGDGSPWCQVGDTIEYAKFTGKFTKLDKTKGQDENEDLLIILRDEDVLAVVEA